MEECIDEEVEEAALWGRLGTDGSRPRSGSEYPLRLCGREPLLPPSPVPVFDCAAVWSCCIVSIELYLKRLAVVRVDGDRIGRGMQAKPWERVGEGSHSGGEVKREREGEEVKGERAKEREGERGRVAEEEEEEEEATMMRLKEQREGSGVDTVAHNILFSQVLK